MPKANGYLLRRAISCQFLNVLAPVRRFTNLMKETADCAATGSDAL